MQNDGVQCYALYKTYIPILTDNNTTYHAPLCSSEPTTRDLALANAHTFLALRSRAGHAH